MTEERYLCATGATNLQDVPHRIGQVDLVKANGMSASNMASHFMRLVSKPTKADMTRVYAALLYVAHKRKFVEPAAAITAAIEWMLDPSCKVCAGVGEIERKGRMHKCPKCKGEKLRREPASRDAQYLIDHVNDCRRALSGRVRKLMR